MTTKIPETLEAKVEQLVRQHLAAQQVAVAASIERAFAVVTATPRVGVRQRAYTRRAPTEVAGLAERLLEAVQGCPGETMTVIAARVGQTPRALNRPMAHLKRAGRVRSAGERSFTRYFPMSAAKS